MTAFHLTKQRAFIEKTWLQCWQKQAASYITIL